MRAIEIGRAVASLVAPPLCAGCGRPCSSSESVCSACARALARERPGVAAVPGLERVVWAARYDGVPRELVAALKFGGRLRLAGLLAARIGAALGPRPASEAVVAVPAAPARRRRRGFDSAELIAAALAEQLALPLHRGLHRADGPRQVGRRRDDRLAAAPRVEPLGAAPAAVLVVDDVLTTGATLAACASALRRAGASQVDGGVFAHAFGPRRRAA